MVAASGATLTIAKYVGSWTGSKTLYASTETSTFDL